MLLFYIILILSFLILFNYNKVNLSKISVSEYLIPIRNSDIGSSIFIFNKNKKPCSASNYTVYKLFWSLSLFTRRFVGASLLFYRNSKAFGVLRAYTLTFYGNVWPINIADDFRHIILHYIVNIHARPILVA